MAYIEWDDKYSVGVSYIDEQHKTLFYIINDIYDQVKENVTPNNVLLCKEVKRLKEYTFFHFLSEEKQMQQLNYIGFDEHKAQHQIFIDKVNDWAERLEKNKPVMYMEITGFLKKWLTDHILERDKNYSKHFKDNGLK